MVLKVQKSADMVEQVVGGRTNKSQRGKDEKKNGIALAGDARITSSKDKFKEVKKRKKLPRKKKEKTEYLVDTAEITEDHEIILDQEEANEGNKELRDTKKRKREKGVADKIEKITLTVQENNQDRGLDRKRSQRSSGNKKRKSHVQSEYRCDEQTLTDNGEDHVNSKLRKVKRKGKKVQNLSVVGDKILKVEPEPNQEEVYQISSGDEDSSKGMKKWVTDYYQSRPGLEVLQERIDEFIEDHEAKLEQERKEREAVAAEGGWTVVTHHKGRKKTKEAESGTVVGSVSQTAVEINMSKKKTKEVGLDFYRFQKREAKRNELMMLQSKFEQDKKRIQELRAARKFRPY